MSTNAIKDILESGNKKEIRALFSFNDTDSNEAVLWKFNLWIRVYFGRYLSYDDAKFHREIDLHNLEAYRGQIKSFLDIAFRDAAKTGRTKLFVGFCIVNDEMHFRQYFKVLAEDGNNSKQIVTDIYNMLISPQVTIIWPEIFEKTDAKREERMESFTTSTRVKIIADTVGSDQRGALADEARPDFIWYEDFENRTTLRSRRKTLVIWDNMEEARTGLAKNGACVYTCNYISEQGNVDRLVKRPKSPQHVMMITPILDQSGMPTWNKYTKADIEQMKIDDDDFEGERMCKPSAAKDIFFDREQLEKQPKRLPTREIAGFKIYYPYNPSHRYGSGHDVAGGVGLDSSTSVFIDFDTLPSARVVATFANNLIRPDTFGDEIQRESDMFGSCISGIEKNNHGHATIARARQLEVNLYATEGKETTIDQTVIPKEYGWHTNTLTKPRMLFALGKAVEDGLLELNDEDLIAELMSYTRNDLIDNEKDPRLVTKHFDLLIACAIAWQMKDYAAVAKIKEEEYVFEEDAPMYPSIGV